MRPPYTFQEYSKRVNEWLKVYRDGAVTWAQAGVPRSFVERLYRRGTKPGKAADVILKAFEV